MRLQSRRPLLFPLVPLYAGIVAAKGWLFDRELLPHRSLGRAVISVGSLSAGGAGKTPVVLMLAEQLTQRGFEVRILTRGYGRRRRLPERVDPKGDATRFGDEPILLARRSGALVYVGGDRHHAARLAEREYPSGNKTIYLLDDGFQHRQLKRDVDLVLVTRQEFDGGLLPAGNLREPLQALARADIVLLRDDELDLQPLVARCTPAPVWTISRRLVLPQGGIPLRPVAFCGIARPEGFFEMLAAKGCIPAATQIFRDHHVYVSGDMERLVSLAIRHHADGFVATEKDAVKLTPALRDRLHSVGPVIAPELRVDLLDPTAAIDQLLALLKESSVKPA
jgi:tetraacyldisaccharide 4'-kinase